MRCSIRPFAGSALLALFAAAGLARASDDNPAFLQWFEARWTSMEARMPDFFLAGYDGVWLPPPSRAADPTSPGYDVFDRFDLGTPLSPTLYGTEAGFRALVAEFKRTGAKTYPDAILNHNSGRTSNQAFFNAGGWPGFVVQMPGDFWGDFNDGTTQSENPNPGPGQTPYNLWNGDLVGLIDIAQQKNYRFIRQPVAADPRNLPAGTIRNRPNPANARFYTDIELAPNPPFQEPGLPPNTFRNPTRNEFITFRAFNTADPTAGDPVVENATDLLVRWCAWMVEDVGVDGFRLDAAKHIPQWFWNDFYDAAVYRRRITPAGTRAIPFSFGESVAGNDFVLTYTRKDGFGNRDALDLNGAGQLRGIHDARGFGSWADVLASHLDVAHNGLQNGSRGVHHVYSHDNGSVGSGGSAPAFPGPDRWALVQNAYVLLRPGPSIVYHNAREFASFSNRGFWPREGNPTALGDLDPRLSRLVQIANGYARGEFHVLNGTDSTNPSLNDVLIFERRTPTGGGNAIGNLLVGLNDRYDSGLQTRNILTTFAPGTRLHELTGNAADATVNPTGEIPQIITVGSDRRVLLRIPNNVSGAGTHHRGYVVYGPAAPSGTLTIRAQGQSGPSAVIPPDPVGTPSFRRRSAPVDVITTPTFDIALTTTKTDLLDPNWDDNALFRINAGYRDFNGNGVIDFGENAGTVAGYEQFLTFNRSIVANPSLNGSYIQTVSSSLLDEGMNYVSVIAFRRRTDGGAPIYTEFRRAVYIDLQPPAFETDLPARVTPAPLDVTVLALDRTATNVHIILNPPAGVDPRTLANDGNRAGRVDRFDWRLRLPPLTPGPARVAIVVFELSGNSAAETYDLAVVVPGDVNGDGRIDIEDLYAISELEGYLLEADLNGDGVVNAEDIRLLEIQVRSGQ